jgi:hypothetical protein
VAKYLARHFVAAHQQVGAFEVIDQFGRLQKNGGNVASYFCTPDGRVIHAVLGPVPPDALLAEARWAVAAVADSATDSATLPTQLAAAHREALAGPSADNPQGRRVHQLLAERPLPPLKDIYRDVFVRLLGQRLGGDHPAVEQAVRAVASASHERIPLLFILHQGREGRPVLDRWARLIGDHRALAGLAASYAVVALPIDELPELSQHLSVRPFAAPDRGLPLFVVARSDGRQMTAVTTWDRADDLARAMALGVVQEAKEHRRTPAQLRRLLGLVEPIDAGLGAQVRGLLGERGRR